MTSFVIYLGIYITFDSHVTTLCYMIYVDKIISSLSKEYYEDKKLLCEFSASIFFQRKPIFLGGFLYKPTYLAVHLATWVAYGQPHRDIFLGSHPIDSPG